MARARAGAEIDWEAVFRVADSVHGRYRARYDAVVAAFEAKVLTGPMPTYNGFWRRAANGRKPGATSSAVGVSASSGSTRGNVATAPPVVQARDRLLLIATQLRCIGALSPDDLNTLKLTIKTGSASRVARRSPVGVEAAITRMTMLADEWELRLTVGVPGKSLDTANTLDTPAPGPIADFDADVETDAVDPPNNDQPHSSIPFGTVVGHERIPAGLVVARLRARLIAPVLSGYITPARCAELVRRATGGIRDSEIGDAFGELPTSDLRRFATLTDRTVRRWVAQVTDGQTEDAAAGRAERTVDEYLRQRYPAGVRRRRKLLPEHREWIKDQYTDQPNASMADVARDLRSEFGAIATVRHIQRILSTELIDTERMDARGGPLASVSYRSKLLREVAYPNQWWIGDHTFVNFEHLDPEHPQLSRGLTDFDLQFEVAVESRRRQGVLRRNRSGICITRWMDACTRLTVGVTIWLTPPNAIQTLASLFPACLRYGIPEGIYTDNGSDFRSNAVQGAVVNVGMRHAFSRPATPEGRGKLERSFQTLKRVLARWPGSLCGRHPVRWATEQPLTPAQLQNAIVQHVALEERTVPNRSTGLPPAIHFERAVGARGLSGTSPEAIARLLTLLPCEVRQRQIFGVEVGNLPYWCPALKTVPIGSRLFVHSIPNEYEYRYLSAPAADGSLRYIGRAPVYDVDHPPPDLAEAAALEAAFDAHIAGVAERAILAGDQAIRLDAADVEGEVIAAAMPHAPLAAASVLASPSMRSLPAPSRGSEAKKLPSKANETEIPDPFA